MWTLGKKVRDGGLGVYGGVTMRGVTTGVTEATRVWLPQTEMGQSGKVAKPGISHLRWMQNGN